MSKLLQYLVNKPSVHHKVLPNLRKMQMAGTVLPKMQRAGQYPVERDATSMNTPALSKMFGIQREIDVDRFSEDAFKQKYKMTPHQYKMRTDSDYAQAFERQMDQRRQNDPNYSEINLPATDVRSKLYRGNPNLALIPKGATGPARAQQEQLFADMTSLSDPLLPVKSLVRGLQVGKAASTAPKIIDKLISTPPRPIKTAATQSVDDSGLIINDEVYRQWTNARQSANIPEPSSTTTSVNIPSYMENWGTGNWNANINVPADINVPVDIIQPYRPVWPVAQTRNTTLDRLNSFLSTTGENIDRKLGSFFSKGTNAPAFDADEVTRLINENLSKGVGVKKENLGLQVRYSPLPYDIDTSFRLETLIDNNKVGSILFQRNMDLYKPKTFSQILLEKLPTPFERWKNIPGFRKTNDFPFQDYNPFNPIKDPTGKTFSTVKDLYSTGISGEFNKAINEALKAKGLGNVLSGGTGHSLLGEDRWKKLVQRGLAEDLGDGYFKLKKQGGPIILPKMQKKGEVKDLPETISINDPRYREMYKNRQVGLSYDGIISLPDLDEVTITAPRSYTMDSLRDFTTAALYGIPENVAKLEQVPTATLAETIAMLSGKPYNFNNVNPNFGRFGSRQRDFSNVLGYENPQGFLQNAANLGLSAIDPLLVAGLTGALRKPLLKGAQQLGTNLTTRTPLRNTYKINPFAVKEPDLILTRTQRPGQTDELRRLDELEAKGGINNPNIEERFEYRQMLKSPVSQPGYGRGFSSRLEDIDYYAHPNIQATRGYEGFPEMLKVRIPSKEAAKFNVGTNPVEGYVSYAPKREFLLPKDLLYSAERFTPTIGYGVGPKGFTGPGSIDNFIRAADTERIAANTPDWLRGYPSVGSKSSRSNFGKITGLREGITSDDVNDLVNQNIKYLESDEYLQRRMANTGESKEQILKDISKYKNRLKNTTINLSGSGDGGLMDPLNIPFLTNKRIKVGKGIANKEEVLGVLDHEIKHMLSPASEFPLISSTTSGARSGKYFNYPEFEIDAPAGYHYFRDPMEQQVRLLKLNEKIRQDLGIKDTRKITEKEFDTWKSKNLDQTLEDPRYRDFKQIYNAGTDKGRNELLDVLNKAWAAPAVGVAVGSQAINQKKNGGPIIDSRGQWAHPGKRTIVPTPTGKITMKGVPYPVYGKDETGFGQMMYPGGEYKFPGQMVDEIPMMQFGGISLLGPISLLNTIPKVAKTVGNWFSSPAPTPSPKVSIIGDDPNDPEKIYGKLWKEFVPLEDAYEEQRAKNDMIAVNDPKSIALTSGRFRGAKVSPVLINEAVSAAKSQGIDPWLMLSVIGRESTFGSGSDSNIRRAGDKGMLVSGWNVAENYQPYDPMRFLADNKVPGIITNKNAHGWSYQMEDADAVAKYLTEHPELFTKYKQKISATPKLGDMDSFDLAAKFLKEKGISRYNPGDSKYPSMVNADMNLLKKDAALRAYMKTLGYKYGGISKMQKGGGSEDSTLENIIEFIDPSGITSWDDATAAYQSWKKSGKKIPSLNQGLDMFGAVPGLGKFGKLKYLANPNAMKAVYKFFPWQQTLNVIDSAQDELEKRKSGGQHGGLDRWFAEKWVDVKTGKACGRQEGEKRAGYPACRPSKRVSSETPKTSSEMSSAEKAKFKRTKTSSERIPYNHKK